MTSGWRYRVASVVGAIVVTSWAVTLANHPYVQHASMVIPVFNRLTPTSLSNGPLEVALATTLVIVLVAMFPLFKPRPRRILDTISLTVQRVLMAMVALAAIGYFDYTYRLPRTTLILATVVMGVVMPTWFAGIRRRPTDEHRRAIIVGDDPEAMATILDSVDLPILGYVSPPSALGSIEFGKVDVETVPDGGVESRLSNLELLGGLSRLDDILVEYDIDTAVLAFSHPDRAEFFGTLDTLYDHGVTAKVHRAYAATVLTADVETGELIDVDLNPWDWQDYLVKRVFDIVFSSIALVLLVPVMAAISLAIKLDDGGPILYAQERTATFGKTLTLYKFRSMRPQAELEQARLSEEDVGGEDDRVTNVGSFLRKTHLDEIPQLWSILIGQMSVVGPRPERPELDPEMAGSNGSWRRRWFVKPGLTGLAQINGVTGFHPGEKLRYDIAYIRNQSMWFDIKILIRQLWMVGIEIF